MKTTFKENSTAVPLSLLPVFPCSSVVVNAGLLINLPNGLAVLVLWQKLLLCLEFYCSASSHKFFASVTTKYFNF